MWLISKRIPLLQLQLCILVWCNGWCAIQASFVHRESRLKHDTEKRFGQSMVEEGLPLWLVRRAVLAEPDTVWNSLNNYDDLYMARAPEDLQVQKAMNLRAQEQMEELRQILNDGNSREYRQRADSHNQPVRIARRDVPSPSGVGNLGGLRSHMSWQPVAIGIVCSVFGIMAIVGAVAYYQKVQLPRKRAKQDAFGGLRPAKPSPTGSLLGDPTGVSLDGDRKLAHSAQMYHYQHQKQQMLAVEKAGDAAQASEEGSESDVEEEEEGDFTVYECPGLATTGQLEVENPLYEGDAITNGPSTNGSYGEIIGASDLEDTSDSTPTTKVE